MTSANQFLIPLLILISFHYSTRKYFFLFSRLTTLNNLVLKSRNDTEEVRKNRMFYLLDTYLNTPDKFLNETALHFASKLGSVEIVELLTSYPECDRERKNNKDETPVDVRTTVY